MLSAPPALSGEIPQGVRLLLQRLVAKEAADRHASIADVRADLAALATTSGAAPQKPHARVSTVRKRLALGAFAVLVLADPVPGRAFRGLAPDLRPRRRRSRPVSIRSIAVLPLDNYSGDPSQDYFAEGMTDELTADLATISQLRVISRGSVMQFKGEQRPPTPEIARMLNVDAIVEGSVSPVGRHGADHGPVDRRAGGQASVGQELRAQLARRAGAAG